MRTSRTSWPKKPNKPSRVIYTKNMTHIIGALAALFSIAGFIPQAIKTIKVKTTDDLSILSWFILFIGAILWLVYGVENQLVPVIAVNSVLLLSSFAIIATHYRFKR